jgi:hypothetical protein
MLVQIDASTARLSVFLAEIEVQIDGPSKRPSRRYVRASGDAAMGEPGFT